MFASRSLIRMSPTLGVILAGSVGLSAFGVPPSFVDRLGWLLHAGELHRATGAVTQTAESGVSLADVVAKVKPAVVSVTSTYTETKQVVVRSFP
jgi:S1-C subfamily serine protease